MADAVINLGRLIKTQYILRYLTDRDLRRTVQLQLNIRDRYGMPATVLAKRVGITRQHLHMIETNKTEDPGAFTVLRIAEALGVSTDYLLKDKRKTRRLTDDVEQLPTTVELVGA